MLVIDNIITKHITISAYYTLCVRIPQHQLLVSVCRIGIKLVNIQFMACTTASGAEVYDTVSQSKDCSTIAYTLGSYFSGYWTGIHDLAPDKDIVPVAVAQTGGTGSGFFCVRKDAKWQTFEELLADMKEELREEMRQQTDQLTTYINETLKNAILEQLTTEMNDRQNKLSEMLTEKFDELGKQLNESLYEKLYFELFENLFKALYVPEPEEEKFVPLI